MKLRQERARWWNPIGRQFCSAADQALHTMGFHRTANGGARNAVRTPSPWVRPIELPGHDDIAAQIDAGRVAGVFGDAALRKQPADGPLAFAARQKNLCGR